MFITREANVLQAFPQGSVAMYAPSETAKALNRLVNFLNYRGIVADRHFDPNAVSALI